MRKNTRDRVWWWLSLILIACASIITGYFIGREKGLQERSELVIKRVPQKGHAVPKKVMEQPREKEGVITVEVKKIIPPEEEESCKDLEENLQEFFRYLDTKNYIRHLEAGMDTYERFKRLVRKLASRPPIPAGEGINTRIITENIYHFSRLLDKKDLRLIRSILSNETDSMEMNLNLFYKWLMAGERCPDPEGVRPSLDLLYPYAGFFLNTIGGRSYLFRRPANIRLLISYYCLLIVHEADRMGKNSYGIDIFPEIGQVLREISFYTDLQFQNDYIHRLTTLQNYYLNKR